MEHCADCFSRKKNSSSPMDDAYPVEILNTLDPAGMSPHRLVLRVGVPITFTRNLSRVEGVNNGTRGIVAALHEHRVVVRLVTGTRAGQLFSTPRINQTMNPEDETFVPFTRRQFPLRVAYAMTINKAQGQTFERVGVWLPSPVFAHGQLYVALSRVGDPSNVRIAAAPGPTRCPPDHVVNEVWKEAFPR
ncbi:hypothetical protein M569_10907 [Genlisea aurea]|uniref:DNA helicase Pif1-like 2B domain-containing protein n=1 Tax=Genlisea aurea TaxID=192259 RepID=S8CAF6_9LAMI|nr:hypothetical protein M569_10907 [Genlisea aurea]